MQQTLDLNFTFKGLVTYYVSILFHSKNNFLSNRFIYRG
jgi:hypothetical protein